MVIGKSNVKFDAKYEGDVCHINVAYDNGDRLYFKHNYKENPRIIKDLFTIPGDTRMLVCEYYKGSIKCLRKTFCPISGNGCIKTYRNGKLHSQMSLHAQVAKGPYYRWHPNGQLAVKCRYVNGRILGRVQVWDQYGMPKKDYYVFDSSDKIVVEI
jgi:hypothetical protein